MKKFLSLFLLIASLTALTSACSQYKLPAAMDEGELTAAAQGVITLLNAGDYQGVSDLFREDVRGQVSAEYLEEALGDMLAALGEFSGFEASAAAGTTNKESQETYGVIVVMAKYAEGKAQFTMYYDLDMTLVGLYMK